LEEWAKASMWVDGKGDEDHVACEEITDDSVADGHGACGGVGFVVASDLLLLILLQM